MESRPSTTGRNATSNKRVLILTAGVGSGHNIAAAVLESCARQDPRVDEVLTLDVLSLTNDVYRRLQSDAYFALVDAAPWLVGWGYDQNDTPFRNRDLRTFWDALNTTDVVKAIERYRPDVTISTHFLPARVVSLMLTRAQVNGTTSIVTTDYDFQGMWLSTPFNRFFVARDETRVHMVEIGLPGDRITVSGIPVRAVFGEPVDRAAVLARYQLRPDIPTLLISAGAAGGAYTHAVVDQTLRMRNAFQAIVVCGRNDDLKREITALVGPHADQYRVVGYSTDIPDLMRVAALFVGKPGGLSSSECMAAGLPMVLIKPIPGQEVRNSDFLQEEGAAVRCNYDTTIGFKIDSLLGSPERLRKMAECARNVGRLDAAATIVATALDEPSASLWISPRAQRAIREAGERGVSARNLGTDGIVTLVDAESGLSVGVVTGTDLRALTTSVDGDAAPGQSITVTKGQVEALNHKRTAADVLMFFKHALGKAERVTVAARA